MNTPYAEGHWTLVVEQRAPKLGRTPAASREPMPPQAWPGLWRAIHGLWWERQHGKPTIRAIHPQDFSGTN